MARSPEGWTLYADPRTGNQVVRFRWQGKRYGISTREKDPRKAKAAAARIYAETVAGRRRRAGSVARAPLDVMLAEWIAAMEDEVPDTAPLYETYAFSHWEPFFGSSAHLTEASVADYMRARLRRVTGSTVRKELSALRRFFAWAKAQGFMTDPPPVPELAKRSQGTRAQPRETVELTAEQVHAILWALPDVARGGYPARAFYAVMWATGLRRKTLQRIEVPKHYRRGGGELLITTDIDKSRWGRVVDLDPLASAALDSVCPKRGLVFGPCDLRRTLKTAGLRAGLPKSQAARLSNHDFRHARTTHLLERGGSLLGVGYLVGHTNPTTTNLYAHARREAGRAALGLGNETGNGQRSGGGAK